MTLRPAARQFLEAHPDVALFGRDGAGHPIGYPMRIVSVDGGRVHFTTYRKSAKVAHFERDGRAAVLAQQVDDSGVVHWLSVEGTAVVWSPTEAELDAVFSGSAGATAEARVPEGMSEFVRRRILEGKRILLTVGVERAEFGSGRA